MSILRIVIVVSVCLALVGCHSASISATISNHRSTPVTLVEVDYPSASFGVQKLGPGEDFRYRFKVIGTGATTLLWSEPAKRDQKTHGPVLREGDEGTLAITFPADGPPTWEVRLHNKSLPR
jgi:hypothetical protein